VNRAHHRNLDSVSRFRALAAAIAVAAALAAASPAVADVSLGGWLAFSPDDLNATNAPGMLTLTGNDNTANVSLPFTFTVEGVGYTSLTLSTNGWIEIGGNTSGNSDPTNDCLPTPAHTNPLVAAYWDDLNPFGNTVRYATVGSSPNRVFIADYEVDIATGEGADDIRFQVQLHEGSNTITVRYRDSQANANGQGATIGFQGAGGAAATTVQPLTCNGKILDDNRPDEGWSADVGRAGQVTLAAMTAHSPDDISGFATLTGNDNTASVTLPFSVTLEGTSYGQIAISTNGWIEFGGNTSGNSDPTNDCLPSAAHTNPLLAAYWDDLNPFGTQVRYGTVGASPNRTFIVDYEVDLTSGNEGSDDLRFQVQIHETSSLIGVRYRDKQSNANGQAATIGFQGAGGAAAASYPITCNGKVLDDNDETKEGWSIHPKAAGAMSLHSVLAFSPDDINATNVPGLQQFSGDDVVQNATLPFPFVIDGVGYTALAISTNGWIEFGGNTSGNSDPTNDCLPTPAHTNPLLAPFWDDMQTAGSSTIRYGTVGEAPNRTFLIDYFLDTKTSSDDGADDVRVHVLIHESSNTISVKYRPSQHLASGQTATIGFQGAGGASAAATPISCNARVIDDNVADSGWSIAPLPICGNGVAETKESCDAGGANGSGASCCTTGCGFRAAGQECRASAGVCDVAESCTGASGSCPSDAFVASGTTCRSGSGDACDPTETCTGGGADCPADVVLAAGAVCRPGSGDACDPEETCSGIALATCPPDVLTPAGTTCRIGSGDLCDPDEACTGVNAEPCPSDLVAPAGTVCRGPADLCDAVESCSGNAGEACPGDAMAAHGVVCRGSIGDCDVAETCTGASIACPGDDVRPAGSECRAATGSCDVAEHCDGSSTGCPPDVLRPATFECRPSTGECDPAETCTGASDTCPGDAFTAPGTACTADSDDCTLDECDGGGICAHTPLPDADGDSVCDARDDCTNIDGGRNFILKPKPKLVVGKINADTTPGNDKLLLGGDVRLSPGTTFSMIDPLNRGARIVVRGQSGVVRLDQALPPGAFVAGGRGWKSNRKGSLWQWVDKTSTPLSGIVAFKVVDRIQQAAGVRVQVKGEKGTYPVVAGDEPLEASVVFGNQSDAVAGLCAQTAFSTADCAFNRSLTQVTCKK
jgi:hypothetical protein